MSKSTRYRFAHADMPAPVPEFAPATLTRCICSKITIAGIAYIAHDPSCLVAGHGCNAIHQPPACILDTSARTIGSLHHGSRAND